MGIGETLRQALTKLVMRAAGEHVKTACGNLRLCAGIKAGIERATHAVGQTRLKKKSGRWQEGEESGNSDEEEVSGGMSARLTNRRIDMEGTEEKAADNL